MKIVGVGHYAPARVVSNHDLEAWLDTSDEWINSRTGMKRRHWTSDDEGTSDLASAAAQAALVHADLSATEVDCFIVATVTPDYYFPATACLVASRDVDTRDQTTLTPYLRSKGSTVATGSRSARAWATGIRSKGLR